MTEKEKALDDLYIAAGKYVKAYGGKPLVAGGIAIQRTEKFKFNLTIRMTGKPPPPPVKESA